VTERAAQFWVFVSGKGGVGKSILALHMARALAENDRRVLLLDADLGLANLHVLANVEPRGRLERVLVRADELESAVTPLEFGCDLLAADNGRNLCLLAGEEAALELAETLGRLHARYDYILVDTPRGISESALRFCRACDRTYLVTTDEPTSITNTYAWYKVATTDDPELPIWLITNRTQDPTLHRRFTGLCRRFLGRAPLCGGSIPEDPAVARAVAKQMPLFQLDPESPAWRATKNLTLEHQQIESEQLTDGPPPPERGGDLYARGG
jgi:flagellar biosynthesis protein FlhG